MKPLPKIINNESVDVWRRTKAIISKAIREIGEIEAQQGSEAQAYRDMVLGFFGPLQTIIGVAEGYADKRAYWTKQEKVQ